MERIVLPVRNILQRKIFHELQGAFILDLFSVVSKFGSSVNDFVVGSQADTPGRTFQSPMVVGSNVWQPAILRPPGNFGSMPDIVNGERGWHLRV